MVHCASCLYPIQKAKCADVNCGMCMREFHLKCVNLSEQGLVFLKEMKKPFVCLDCMRAAENRGNVYIPPPFAVQPQPVMSCPEFQERITLNDLISAIKSNTDRLNTFIEGQKNNSVAIQSNKEVERSLECCHEMIQSNNKAINILHVKIDQVTSQVNELKREKSSFESRIKDLEDVIRYLKIERTPIHSRSSTPPIDFGTRSLSHQVALSRPQTPNNEVYEDYNCY